MTLRTVIHCGIEAEYLGSSLFSSQGGHLNIVELAPIRMESGVAAGYADKLYCAEITISASSSQDLDLAGSLEDAFGVAFSPAKVRAILIEADSGNTNNVEVGGAASNGFLGWFKDATDILTLAPGDRIMLSSRTGGKTVTAGTADILKVANSSSGTSVTLRIVIIGTSS